MFPMAAIDFAFTKYSPHASWALQLPEDLTSPVLGTVLLLVNTRDHELGRALSSPRPGAHDTVLLDELETAVGAYLLAQAIERKSEIESEDWPDQSTGSLLAHYLDIAVRQKVPEAMATGDAATSNAALVGAARAEGFGRRLA